MLSLTCDCVYFSFKFSSFLLFVIAVFLNSIYLDQGLDSLYTNRQRGRVSYRAKQCDCYNAPNPISVWRCDVLPTVMLCLDEGIGICANTNSIIWMSCQQKREYSILLNLQQK